MLGLASGDDRLDPAGPQLAAVLVVVIATIGDHLLGALAWSADLPGNRANSINQRQKLGDVVAMAAGQADRKRDAVTVDYQVVL
jgi:hypothetical protein